MNYLNAILYSFAFLLISCGQQYDTQEYSSTPSTIVDSGQIKRWNITDASILPLHLVMKAGDFTSTEKNEILSMMSKWDSNQPNYNFFTSSFGSSTKTLTANLSDYQDDEMGIYRFTDKWFEGHSSALAITQYFAIMRNVGTNDEHLELKHADIMVNNFYYDFSTDPSYEYDLGSVIIHELGHFIGFNHQNDFSIDSIMHPSIMEGEVKQTLSDYDKQVLLQVYPSGLSSLKAGTAILKKLDTQEPHISPEKYKEGELVRGLIELKKDKTCSHHLYKIKKAQ